MTDAAGFSDLAGETPARLTELLRASVISGAAATAAAVEMLVTAYDGLLLRAPLIQQTIREHDGHVVVDWARLAKLARLMSGEPDAVDIPDLVELYQKVGLPANSRHVLTVIAALGNGEIGVRESIILASAFQHVALASNDWLSGVVDVEKPPPLSVSYTLTLHSGLVDRLHTAADATGRTPLHVIREALETSLPTGTEDLWPMPPPGRAQPDGR
mgnify:CR=1 FL=1